MNEKAIILAEETFNKIEELRIKRSELQNDHALEIGSIDSQLNQLFAKLAAALSVASK